MPIFSFTLFKNICFEHIQQQLSDSPAGTLLFYLGALYSILSLKPFYLIHQVHVPVASHSNLCLNLLFILLVTNLSYSICLPINQNVIYMSIFMRTPNWTLIWHPYIRLHPPSCGLLVVCIRHVKQQMEYVGD
jgi:hypothetical protein